MTDDANNPYRFAAVEREGEGGDAPASPFRQPETGRKLSANDVRILASSQRGLWICAVPLALWSFVWVVTAVAPIEAPAAFASIPEGQQALVAALFGAMGLVVLVAWVGGLVFVLAIASRTHPTWLGFAIWFVAMYPPILLLMLPYLQSRAARALNRHGIPANLFGADRKSLPKAGAQPLSSTPTP
jgi:hypothetical protein